MYKVMRVYRDEYGALRQRYVGERVLKNIKTAQRIADANRGGYVVRYGALSPVYVGVWQ